MIDTTTLPIFEILGLAAGLVPIVVLAAFSFVDLRAIMLRRAVSLQPRPRAGETLVSGEQW